MPASGIDPQVDYAFKRLFGVEERMGLCADLVNAVLGRPPGLPHHGFALMNTHHVPSHEDQKESIYDVRVRDFSAAQFHLEMQRVPPWSFTGRAVYYWATLHGQRMRRSDFYETLRPTHTICFVGTSLFPGPRWHRRFRLLDEDGESFCDDCQIHVVELGKFLLRAEEVRTALERWCYFLNHGADLAPESLPATLDAPAIREALEVLTMLSQNEAERQEYISRHIAEQDAKSLREAPRLARQQGLEEGMEKGMEKGAIIGQIQLFQKLLKQPQTANAALEAMPLDDLRQRFAALESQFAGT
ncbi:MAG: Rpn family recombination-promoting nuclease/putative transposase [Gemmataceae bacterium]|nr:Rpn family recombination-promoting nuclease/putative transposase [Gemmataceae bacterium]